MKVTIDREECISCGACYADCPKVFEENLEDFFSQIVGKYRVDANLGIGEVPQELRMCVEDAVYGCRVEIIHIEE